MRDDSDDWELIEAGIGDKRFCTDVWHGETDAELARVYRTLRNLAAAGMPPDKNERHVDVEFDVGEFEPERAGCSFGIHILKSKPKHWRTYFCIHSANKQQLLMLHTVKKKKTSRTETDNELERCATVLTRVWTGNCEKKYGLYEIELPDC